MPHIVFVIGLIGGFDPARTLPSEAKSSDQERFGQSCAPIVSYSTRVLAAP
jgi:hypothetical protein